MLKQLLVSTTLLLLAAGIFAQSHRFADSTAQWNVLETQYYFCPCVSVSTNTYTIAGDTLLNNKSYQIVSYDNFSDPYPMQQNGNYYLRQDTTGKVYGLVNSDSTEYMLYDFSKQPGDTFSIDVRLGWPYPVKTRIDSIGTVMWGHSRRIQYVTTQSHGEFKDVFVEGIGAINSFLIYPGAPSPYLDGPSYNVLCFTEQANLVYHHPSYDTCFVSYFWMNINETATGNIIQVYPNPASNVVTVTFNESNQQTLFTLTDLTGRVVLQQPLSNKQSTIDISGMAAGAYIYHIQSGNLPAYSGKLYKQ